MSVRRLACAAAQLGDEHGAEWGIACRGRRHAASSLAHIHDDLRKTRYRRPAHDRTAVVGGGRCPMSLRHELERYLTIRRSLGYDLRTTERVLRRFVDFAEAEQASNITIPLLLRWQDAFGQAGQQTWAARFGMVRLFAQWLHGLDAAHEVPSRGLIP